MFCLCKTVDWVCSQPNSSATPPHFLISTFSDRGQNQAAGLTVWSRDREGPKATGVSFGEGNLSWRTQPDSWFGTGLRFSLCFNLSCSHCGYGASVDLRILVVKSYLQLCTVETQASLKPYRFLTFEVMWSYSWLLCCGGKYHQLVQELQLLVTTPPCQETYSMHTVKIRFFNSPMCILMNSDEYLFLYLCFCMFEWIGQTVLMSIL